MNKGFKYILSLLTLILLTYQSSISQIVTPEEQKDTLNLLNRENQDSGYIRSVTAPSLNNNTLPNSLMPIEASFVLSNIELNETDIVSNTLRLQNKSNAVINFFVEISHPADWKLLYKTDKWYSLNPNDSMFLPVRIIPNLFLKGNVEYTINAFIFSEDGAQLANAQFLSETRRKTNWQLTALPTENVYFFNGSKTAPFAVNILNTGNEQQEVLMSFMEIGKGAVVLDSTDKNVTNKFYTMSLESGQDTTYSFHLTYTDFVRNQRRMDIDGHRPRIFTDERKFSLFIKTVDPDRSNKNAFRTVKRITFYKLPNCKKANPYSSAVLPLIMDANIFNILTGQPLMNVILRGSTILENKATLIYMTQLNFTSYFANTQQFLHNAFYVGYFHKRGDIQIGNVGAGTTALGGPVSGKGINGSYIINNQHKVGAFFVRRPTLFNASSTSTYGLSYRFTLNDRNSVSTTIGRQQNPVNNLNFEFGTLRVITSPVRNQSFSAVLMGSRGSINNSNVKNGYLINLNYSGRYIKSKLLENLRFMWRNNFMNYFGNSKNFNVNNRINYRISNHWSTFLTNNYAYNVRSINDYNTPNVYIDQVSTSFSNTLSFQRGMLKGAIAPNAFYNINKNPFLKWHFRGLGLDYNYFDNNKNVRLATNLRAGYNYLPEKKYIRDFFSFQATNMIQYKTFSLLTRYYYGPQTISDTSFLYGIVKYPQYFFVSTSYQYLFKDTRFMIQTNVNYSYFNQTLRHNLGIYPDFYYFTYNGWRFRLTLGYNFNSSNPRKANYFNNLFSQNKDNPSEASAKITNNINLQIGVRKEFGIPIPKRLTKKRYTSVDFVAFLDGNGNKIKDRDEIALENVVVEVGDNWVQTDDKGKTCVKNLENGKYKFIVFSLDELKGWFPNKPDSIQVGAEKTVYIPFSRGVKVYGNISVDREKIAAELSGAPVDLSRIRISALDTTGFSYSTLTGTNGSFELFVPLGKYTLNMDEGVLGDRFTLVRNNILIDFKEGTESVFQSFYIVEKKRKLSKKKFGANGKVIETGGSNGTTNPVNNNNGNNQNNNTNPVNRTTPANNNPVNNNAPAGNGQGNNQQGNNGNNNNGNNRATGNVNAGAGNVNAANNNANPNNPNNAQIQQNKQNLIANSTKSTSIQGVVFTVQVGAFGLPLNPSYFDPLHETLITEELPNGLIRVSGGFFKNAKDAEVHKKEMIALGFKDAYVIAYSDGKYISAAEATKLIK